MEPTHKPVTHFPENTLGRDFVVGDIHGAFDQVRLGMQAVNFDSTKDRLFCVGDLVDRGPESARALRFLSLSFVHAVRGNHEQNLLDLYADGEPDEDGLRWFAQTYRAQWWLDLDASMRKSFLKSFARLPIAMDIETSRGLVGVVHGDVPHDMPWDRFCQQIELGAKDVLDVALEGRKRIKDGSQERVDGVDRLFVGHTPQWGGVKRFGNVYAVDTGAVFAQIIDGHEGHLTLANIACRTEVILAPHASNDVRVVTVTPDGPRPFS